MTNTTFDPIYSALPYHRKAYAMSLKGRGADASLLYLWYNLINGNYSHIEKSTLMADLSGMMVKYPEFCDDIAVWFQTYEKVVNEYE